MQMELLGFLSILQMKEFWANFQGLVESLLGTFILRGVHSA